ncbi:tetratricopeptide repeat protein [Oscillatoria sp. CS-180]|uniref:tetratricopeptide repeat protein n=1 Tax=Oscillatoria sp. CS-180 TaxID=3021720 RepID=UPI002FEE183C
MPIGHRNSFIPQESALAPDNADAYYNRGKVYTELDNAEAALTDFDTAIQLNPELAEAYGNRGILRYQFGELELALTDLQQAAELFGSRGDQQELCVCDLAAAVKMGESAVSHQLRVPKSQRLVKPPRAKCVLHPSRRPHYSGLSRSS